MPLQFTSGISLSTRTLGISQRSNPASYPTSTCSLLDSLASHSPSKGKGKASKIHAENSSSISSASSKQRSRNASSSRTFHICFRTIRGKPSGKLPLRLSGLATVCNTESSTAKTLAYRKTVPECSLSVIIDSDPSPRLYFSSRSRKRILSYQHSRRDIMGRKQLVAISVKSRRKMGRSLTCAD